MSNLEDITLTAIVNCEITCNLEFNLKNDSEDELTFYGGFLSRDKIVLLIQENKPFGRVLEEQSFSQNPIPEIIKIGPGSNYQSKINLPEIFPEISEKKNFSELVLFWSANISPVSSENQSKSFGGYFIFNQ